MGVGEAGRETKGQCKTTPGSLSPGLEILCSQEIRNGLALMGELPAPCPQFWKLGLLGPCLTGASQLQSRGQGETSAPTRESPASGVLPTPPADRRQA